MRLQDRVNIYISKSESFRWKAERSRDRKVLNAIIIPSVMEYNNIHTLLSSLNSCDPEYFGQTELIFVINNKITARREIREDNQNTLEFLKAIMNGCYTGYANLKKYDIGVSVIDASSKGFEMDDRHGGVGMARKIGLDQALAVFDYNDNRKKLLIWLDADCRVERNYLTEIVNYMNGNPFSAAQIKYAHNIENDDEHTKAVICYEIFLRYYVLGLKYAGSPFAFHAIGSALVCDVPSYISVGGMNIRKAGEDFYFMEKMAKRGKIGMVKNTVVTPSSRASWRVPFGTGQRITRFLKATRDEYTLYDPESFDILKKWIGLLNDITVTDENSLIGRAESISPLLAGFLNIQGFSHDWKNILKNSQDPRQIQTQQNLWFDAFRTMKLIHYLRDNKYPPVNMFDALNILFKKMNLTAPESSDYISDIDAQREFLRILRNLT